jgi:hypothetical protein
MLQWFRSLHYICFNPEYFEGIKQELLFNIIPLTVYDSNFILPLLGFALNYFTVSVLVLIFRNLRESIIRFSCISIVQKTSLEDLTLSFVQVCQ